MINLRNAKRTQRISMQHFSTPHFYDSTRAFFNVVPHCLSTPTAIFLFHEMDRLLECAHSGWTEWGLYGSSIRVLLGIWNKIRLGGWGMSVKW